MLCRRNDSRGDGAGSAIAVRGSRASGLADLCRRHRACGLSLLSDADPSRSAREGPPVCGMRVFGLLRGAGRSMPAVCTARVHWFREEYHSQRGRVAH